MENQPPLSLAAAHTLHLQALTRLRRSPATLQAYRVYVGALLRFLDERGAGADLGVLDVRTIEDFQDWLRARSYGSRDGAAAERQALRIIRAFARWLWRRGFLEHDPLARLEVPRLPKVHRQPFSEDEMRRLAWAARAGPHPELERALLLLGVDTGCRIGELCAATTFDLDLDLGVIVFRASTTKTGRPRRVVFRVQHLPDGGPCVVALGAWLAVRRPQPGIQTLFVDREGFPLTPARARRIYRALGTSAGVPNCIPHRGRHTAATELLSELPGAEIHLRNRLGHLSQDVLSDYISISDPMAQRVADVASLSAKWDL